MQEKDVISINLGDVFFALWKRRAFIIALALVGLCLGILLNFVKSLKQTELIKASIVVTSVNSEGRYTADQDPDQPSAEQFRLEQEILEPAMYIITSDRVLDTVADKLDLSAGTEKLLKSAISVQQYGSTQIMDISLTWTNGQDGVRILNALLEALPDALIGTLDIGGVVVLNEPQLQTTSFPVDLKLVLILAVICGLCAMGYIILRTIFRPTLIDAKDVKEKFDADLIGTAETEKIEVSMYNDLLLKRQNRFSAKFEQSYAYMAHLISYKMQKNNEKFFFLTSCHDGEAKTTSAANLAIQMSYFKDRTLLLDLDVKHPGIGKLFFESVPHERSLNAVLVNECLPQDAVIHLTSYLDILPLRVETRSVRLTNTIFEKLRQLGDKYDIVVIDAPPVDKVMEVLNLYELTKECVFMIRQDKASQDIISENIDSLRRVGFDILGCIVSRVVPVGPFKDQRFEPDRDAEAPGEITEEERKAKERKINEERYQFRKRRKELKEEEKERAKEREKELEKERMNENVKESGKETDQESDKGSEKGLHTGDVEIYLPKNDEPKK